MIKQKIIFGIDRKEISHFTKIKLTQTINDHHFFKITVPQAVIEAQMAYTITKSQEWIGKTIHIQLENSNNFLGIIKYVNFIQKGDHVGNQIEISGYSKTDLLNSGKKRYSWENCTLKEIVESVLRNGVGKFRELKNQINPEYKHEIKYQTQYNETDFEFLQRLAKQYKEWFYYDCEQLIFGKPEKFDAMINLLFQSDLSHLKIALQAVPHKLSGYTYDENSDTLYKVETNEEIEGFTQLGKHVFKASAELYNTPDATQERISAGNEVGLEHSLSRKMQSIASETEYVIARSRNPKLKIGSLIAISAQEKLSYNYKNANSQVPQYDTHGVGAYIITEITHKATDIGEYQNRFKALPAHITKLPEPQIAEPIAKTQEALVIANNDPMGYGRIRVRMQWQYGGMQTPWLRVMSADAGSSLDVPTNRGNVFIPEVDDHVALNFWDDDPNKPFVIGSLFTGKTGRGGGANNDFRTITDGSGQYFEFEKYKNITLSDQKGNMYHVDSVGDTLNIRALETINFYAKNINLNASENLTANVGNTMTFNVVKNAFFNIFQKMQVNTPYLHQLITGLFHTNASKALINSDNEIKLESPEMYVAGQKKLFLHSDEVATVNSKGTLDIKGQDGNKQSNVADVHEMVKEEIIANCVVHFRPHTNWIGEFGFDWLRIGDTSHSGDVWYKNIVGEYEYSWNDINLQIYDGGSFEAKDWAYKKLKNEYGGIMTVPFLKNSYIVPYLTLYKGKTSKLSLEMNIQAPPKKLEFKYDDTLFKLNHKDIAQKTKGKHTLPDFLEITCIKTFSDDKYIEVLADDMIVGKLRVHKNGKIDRKKINVVLAKVKTNVTGKYEIGTITAEHPKLERHLKQALITPHIVNEEVDLTKDTFFMKKFITKSKKINYKGKELHDYMLKNYDLKTKYPDSFIIYIFDLEVPAPGGGLYVGEAYDINCDNALVFKNKKASTLTHEFLHGLGLYHTFDNDGKFTFEKNKTDNIMDYSTNRYSIFVWQWYLIRKHKLIKPE